MLTGGVLGGPVKVPLDLASSFHEAPVLGRGGVGAVVSGWMWHLGVTRTRVSSRVGASSKGRGSCGVAVPPLHLDQDRRRHPQDCQPSDHIRRAAL